MFYVYEYRSPLNVVHAGLDILLSEMRSALMSAEIIELIEDIFSASESAIYILNDLLEYEHLDAGTINVTLK
jgi:signal transduction histidine kinase